jgi:hypothetical protein
METEKKHWKINLPASLPNPDGRCPIDCNGSLVFVGANGAGKSRLGAWIEFQSEYVNETHRISAQKSLDMPKSVRAQSVDAAERASGTVTRAKPITDG